MKLNRDYNCSNEECKYLISYYGLNVVPIFDYDTEKGDIVIGLYDVDKDSFKAVPYVFNGGFYTYDLSKSFVLAMFKENLSLYIGDYIKTIYKRLVSKESICISVEYYDNDNESNNRREMWAGTMDELFERFERKNNSLKYCNGCGYRFVNKDDIAPLYQIWCKIIPFGRSWELCYPTGLVD